MMTIVALSTAVNLIDLVASTFLGHAMMGTVALMTAVMREHANMLSSPIAKIHALLSQSTAACPSTTRVVWTVTVVLQQTEFTAFAFTQIRPNV